MRTSSDHTVAYLQRGLTGTGLLLWCCLLASCAGSRPDPTAVVAVSVAPPVATPDKSRKITIGELDQLTYAFADRYFMTISTAVDRLKRENPDPEQRRSAHRLKVIGVLAMNDIASSQDPSTQVLNLVVSVTLQARVWIDEGRAQLVFGERAPILVQALIEIRRDVWNLAERVMTPDQMERLELMITGWRRQHPQQDQVAFVKFDEFAANKASNLAKEMSSSGGLLAPLDDANRELVEYRRLAERAFWYTKRTPSIAGIQAEGASNEILASPEITKLFENVDRVTATAERLDQRIGDTLAMVTEHGPAIAATTKELMGSLISILQEARQTIAQVESGMKTLHELYPHLLDPPATPGRPFNIVEYSEALRATAEVLHEANTLAGQSPAASTLVTEQLRNVASFTDARLARVFTFIWITVGLIFAGILAVLAVIRLSARRSS